MDTRIIEKTVQNQEFRFVGMSRSGNHAIINWIINQLDGKFCFLNCAEPKYNPFTSARPLDQSGQTYKTNIENFSAKQERLGEFSEKDYLLYSHEDCFLGTLNKPAFLKNRNAWVGPSASQRDVLILRDPFNLFASRIKSGLMWGNSNDTQAKTISALTLNRIYKQHARELLGEKKYLRNKVIINYNTWTSSREYRKNITEQLGIPFSDKGFEKVSNTAGGSSFDGTKLSGKAYKMNLHSRWENFISDEKFRALFDNELVELSREIFGDIPPVKYFEENHSFQFS